MRFVLPLNKEETFKRNLDDIHTGTLYELRGGLRSVSISSCRSSARYFNGIATSIDLKYKELVLDWLTICVEHFNLTEKYVFIKEKKNDKFVLIYDKGEGGGGDDIHALQLVFAIGEDWGPVFLDTFSLINRNVKTSSYTERVSLACYLTTHPREVDKKRWKIVKQTPLSANSVFYGRFPFCCVSGHCVTLNRDMNASDRRNDHNQAFINLGGVSEQWIKLEIESLDLEKLTYFKMIQYYKTLCAFYILGWAFLVSAKKIDVEIPRFKTETIRGINTKVLVVKDIAEIKALFKEHRKVVTSNLHRLVSDASHIAYLLKPFDE